MAVFFFNLGPIHEPSLLPSREAASMGSNMHKFITTHKSRKSSRHKNVRKPRWSRAHLRNGLPIINSATVGSAYSCFTLERPGIISHYRQQIHGHSGDILSCFRPSGSSIVAVQPVAAVMASLSVTQLSWRNSRSLGGVSMGKLPVILAELVLNRATAFKSQLGTRNRRTGRDQCCAAMSAISRQL